MSLAPPLCLLSLPAKGSSALGVSFCLASLSLSLVFRGNSACVLEPGVFSEPPDFTGGGERFPSEGNSCFRDKLRTPYRWLPDSWQAAGCAAYRSALLL